MTEIGRTFKDTIFIRVKHSNPTPVGVINVHLEKTTQDIDLTDLIADSDIEKKRSILYMPKWPDVIEQGKILFIPK